MTGDVAPPYIDLASHEWSDIIEQLKNDAEARFVLDLWKHMQSAPVGALRAFGGKPYSSEPANIAENNVIGRITKAVRGVRNVSDGHCYFWNSHAQSWDIGIMNVETLRRAMQRCEPNR